jgi:hypothetical protein
LGSSASNAQHENFYGFYVGGPVRIPKLYNGRGKTFFFVGVEPVRIKNALSFRDTFNTPDDYTHNQTIRLKVEVCTGRRRFTKLLLIHWPRHRDVLGI